MSEGKIRVSQHNTGISLTSPCITNFHPQCLQQTPHPSVYVWYVPKSSGNFLATEILTTDSHTGTIILSSFNSQFNFPCANLSLSHSTMW